MDISQGASNATFDSLVFIDNEGGSSPSLTLIPSASLPMNFFNNATNVTFHKVKIIDNRGIQILFDHSIPEAAHNSPTRYPPPRCHPGTRLDIANNINSWRSNEPKCRILWIEGPSGVGKSAIAQSYVESLDQSGDLGAAFFFSHPNGRDDPHRFFTSISYQLAIMYQPYRQILEIKLSDDPTLVTRSIREQLHGLIAGPFKELEDRGEGLKEKVIVIDGLDSCASSDVQRDIVEVVAGYVEDSTSPFHWVFFSRAEPGIKAIFASEQVSLHSRHVELSIARNIDHDIWRYLTDELGKIGEKHELPSPWPSDEDIRAIVNLSAGLFVFAETVVRFVGSSPGPTDRLSSVLSATKVHRSPNGLGRPLPALDALYTLIMQNIPPENLATAREILLIMTFPSYRTRAISMAELLNLSESRFQDVCDSFSSVLALQSCIRDSHSTYLKVRFFHASFMEFLQDPARSGKFYDNLECAKDLRRRLFEELNSIHAARSLNRLATWPSATHIERSSEYQFMLEAFLTLCQLAPPDTNILAGLKEFKFGMIPVLAKDPVHLQGIFTEALLQNIPGHIRSKLITRVDLSFPSASYVIPNEAIPGEQPFILGRGKSRALCWKINDGLLVRPHLEHPRFNPFKAA